MARFNSSHDPERQRPVGVGAELKRRLGLQLIFLVIVGGLMAAWLGWQKVKSGPLKNQVRPGRVLTDEEIREQRLEQARREGREWVVHIDSPEDRENLRHDRAALENELEPDLDGDPEEDAEKAEGLAPFVERPEVLAMAAARDRSAEDEESGTVVDPAISYLLHKAMSDPQAVLQGEPVLRTRGPDGPGEQVQRLLLENPDMYRGRLIELVGNVVEENRGFEPIQLRGLPDDDPSGIDKAFRSYVYSSNEKYFLIYTGVNQDQIHHLDGVRFRGYFCRLYTNDVEIDGRSAKGTIPILVGVRHEVLTQKPPPSPAVFYLFPIVLVLPLIGAAFIWFFSRRTERTYEERRRKGRLSRSAPQGSPGSEGGVSPA